MTETLGYRVQVMNPSGEWVEVVDAADPILARVGEDFRARATIRPAVTGPRVFCRGCHAAVAEAEDLGLGGKCYEEAATTALEASARATELENRSQA